MNMDTPIPFSTGKGKAAELGLIRRYETDEGPRYMLEHGQKGSPRAFRITRQQVHEKMDDLLDNLDRFIDERGGPTPTISPDASRKWSGRVSN